VIGRIVSAQREELERDAEKLKAREGQIAGCLGAVGGDWDLLRNISWRSTE
jgi:hypothetical protein